MTTASGGGFLSDMPSVTAMTSMTPLNSVEVTIAPSSPESLVVIDGLSAVRSINGEKEVPEEEPTPSSSPEESSPLMGIVPALSATARVVVTSTAAGSQLASPSGNSKSSIGNADSPQIIVGNRPKSKKRNQVSEGDAGLESSTNGASGNAGVSLNVAETRYLPTYPMYNVGDTTMFATQPYYTGTTAQVTLSQESGNSPVSGQMLATPVNAYLIQASDVESDATPAITSSRHSPQTDAGVTYMVSSNANSSENNTGASSVTILDADTQANIAHATRVSPMTVQWLLDNYETADGVSLPRSTLYNHYLHHCADQKLDPVNSASFGKLIRSVFMGLRTRRLGTRGNSKYHYYGLRVKANSILNNFNEEGTAIIGQHGLKKVSSAVSPSSAQSFKTQASSGAVKIAENFEAQSQTSSEASPQVQQNQQYLGDVARTAVQRIPDINIAPTAGLSRGDIKRFQCLYKEHWEALVDAIYNLQFQLVESIWQKFWALGNNNNNVISPNKMVDEDLLDEDEGQLVANFAPNVFQTLVSSPSVLTFMKVVDYQLYQNLVEVLIPDVLRAIPSTLTQAIRNFAKSLESWLVSALVGYPEEMVDVKVGAVSSLAQTLRRYTSLNHLAQAARAVLQNSSQISQMLSDLNRVDFHNVHEQASWVCRCDIAVIDRLVDDFKTTLQQQNSLEQWADWLQRVVDQVLNPHDGQPDFTKQARQFLLKWSFYSSMVIRDLTLRSAASFGSFHLIRLLYDEYMFYLVEQKVANFMGLSPIAVMSEYHDSLKENIDSPLINGDASIGGPQRKKPKFENS